MEFTENDWKRVGIFYPYLAERTIAAIGRQAKFAHYSSGDAALSMIKNREVWMRKTTGMNDPSEGFYGLQQLHDAYESPVGERLRRLLDEVFPNLRNRLEHVFNSWQEDFRENTYITSLTEQMEGDEEENGRLSMWRGYPGLAPVAIVVNGGPFLRPSDALNAYTSPVAYLNSRDFQAQFARLVDGMETSREFLVEMGEDDVYANLFAAFRYAAICTKHPGHAEDKEWRIVHTPSFEPSSRLVRQVTTIKGRPQTIFKIPLQNVPDEGLYGVELPELVHRLIIGPGANQRDTREAFIALFEDAGVTDAASKVWISAIPLRDAV